MDWHTISAQQTVKKFGSDSEKGLSRAEVKKREIKYGKNVVSKEEKRSFLKKLSAQFSDFMVIILIIAACISFVTSFISHESDYIDTIIILGIVIINAIIGVMQESRAEKEIESLKKLATPLTKVLRDGKIIRIASQDVVPGDILILKTGDLVCADARIIESANLAAEESAMTGESFATEKNENEILNPDTPVADRKNMLFCGSIIDRGHAKAIVTEIGENTEVGKVSKLINTEKQVQTPLQQRLAVTGKTVAIGIMIVSIAVFILGILQHTDFFEMFMISISLAVAAIPEGLPAVVTIVLANGVRIMAKRNTIVRNLPAVETLGHASVICSDKTGTLTENRMTVKRFYDTTWHSDASELSNEFLAHNICLNTTADIGENGEFIGNPTECAMLNFFNASSKKTYKEERADHKTLSAFPFSSELKHMTTISNVDGKIISYVKGSPECVLKMCALSAEEFSEIENAIVKAEKMAMRVIAFAHKELDSMRDYTDESEHQRLESEMVFDGVVAIADPLRAEVYDAVKSCQSAGVGVKILTGDNIVTASAIANELHLLDNGGIAIEAKNVEEMCDEELSSKLDKICVIARSTPSVKMRVVKLLKAKGEVVAVTGDGINDAPALKNADVGIAMGISGTEVSKEASDIVLVDDSFATIVKAVEWGRNIYENFKRFISFQLTVNIASVICVFVSVLMGLDAPFTALQLLWINIIMDGPPALTLGLEPNYSDLMSRKPTNRSENIISKEMLIKIFSTGIFMSIVFLCQYRFNFLGAQQNEMKTVLFTLFVLFQLFNAFNCRELHEQTIFKHLFKNKLMLGVVGCTFALQVLIIQFAGAFFGTVPLAIDMWLKIFALAMSVIVISEGVKGIIRVVKKVKN